LSKIGEPSKRPNLRNFESCRDDDRARKNPLTETKVNLGERAIGSQIHLIDPSGSGPTATKC